MNVPPPSASIFSSFPQIVFGFSTRAEEGSPEVYRRHTTEGVRHNSTADEQHQQRFLEQLGVRPENLATAKQVHGDNVVRVYKPGSYESCDALVTNEKDIYLRISAADCLPVFLFDPKSRSVAAIHAGWRGCAQRIVQKTIMRMEHEFSADPGMLRVCIGPSARMCCYEVGEEVASLFDGRYVIRKSGARPRLDMLGFTIGLLRESHARDANIETSPHCTICTPHLFHSYRRDGAKSGRMTGVIGIRRIDF